MNKEYAIEVLEMVERGMLDGGSSLAKDAFGYLRRLKKVDGGVLDRINKIVNR